jgi:enoyl-CoA hydratase
MWPTCDPMCDTERLMDSNQHQKFEGNTLSWNLLDGVIELSLHHAPANEMGRAMLDEAERFVVWLESHSSEARVLIIYSQLKSGFSAGGDLREMYMHFRRSRQSSIRSSLERGHRVLNAIDSSPLTTIAAIHGICFGGGLELALTCDIIIADKMSRFCFPELRLGLIPGGGGIPRLRRDTRNGFIRDLLLTGRSINCARAVSAGLVSQQAAEGEALNLARSTAAHIKKLDSAARTATKRLIKPIPYDELRREMEIFCELFSKPAVMAGLQRFVESTDLFPYLP